jgi:hypothetical protein
VINGSDYTLIDNAFNMQGAVLAASISPPTTAMAAIPLPPAADASSVQLGDPAAAKGRSQSQSVSPGIFETETPIAFPQSTELVIEMMMQKRDVLDSLGAAGEATT